MTQSQGDPTSLPRSSTGPSFCDTVRVDDRTVLIIGQELDVQAGQPDVANCLMHLSGETLVVIDTGATLAFREAIRLAAEEDFDGWSRLLLLTTHGHTDHVGNNDMVDQLAAARGATVKHFVPAADVAQMRDPVSYWTHVLRRIDRLAEMPAPPPLSAAFIVSLFEPLHPFGKTTKTYEDLPLVAVDLGPIRLNGWSFLDGAVTVLRSQGHCSGHVVVYLRDSRLLHLGDEDNGACGAMPDSDQVKLQAAFSLVGALLSSGTVEALTDGHGHAVRRGDEAGSFIAGLLDDAASMYEFGRSARGDTVDDRQFVKQVSEHLAATGVNRTNPNPVFTAMMSVNVLSEAGLSPPDHGHSWSAGTLSDPEPVSAKPRGLALLPAAVEMTAWKLKTRHR